MLPRALSAMQDLWGAVLLNLFRPQYEYYIHTVATTTTTPTPPVITHLLIPVMAAAHSNMHSCLVGFHEKGYPLTYHSPKDRTVT